MCAKETPMTNPEPFIFFGTPYVARDTLASLLEAGYTPSLVVTSPDRPRGRGMTLSPCETKEWALAHNLPVFSPEKLDEAAVAEIRAVGATYALVVAYGKILPESLINVFPKGLLNVHYSLLPKYRGASPVEAALLNGDAVTGVAIQKLVKEMDAGDIVAMEETAILPDETTKELRARLITLGANLLIQILPAYLAGEIAGTPQDHSLATRCRKIPKEDGLLDLGAPSEENWRKYRAYFEGPGTYFFVERDNKQMRVKIRKASYVNDTFIIERVVPEGKSEMTYTDFTN
jgi:methionyl-tRNA formyltransferase